jgi:hypothetical protein
MPLAFEKKSLFQVHAGTMVPERRHLVQDAMERFAAVMFSSFRRLLTSCLLIIASTHGAFADGALNVSETNSKLTPAFALSNYPMQVRFSKETGWNWADARYMRSLPLSGLSAFLREIGNNRNVALKLPSQLPQSSTPILDEELKNPNRLADFLSGKTSFYFGYDAETNF